MWFTFYLGPIFMFLLAILNIYTSIKIYKKNIKFYIIPYWILAIINLLMIFFIMQNGFIIFPTEYFITVVIISPYILSIYLLKLIK